MNDENQTIPFTEGLDAAFGAKPARLELAGQGGQKRRNPFFYVG
jgi:hypothetical protein